MLSRYLIETVDDSDNDEIRGLIQFICEQLHLCQLAVQGRAYSKELLTEAFLLFISSHSAYPKLKNLLILPSLRHLQQLSSYTSVVPSEIDVEYLEERKKALSDDDKLVVLLIDEVYTASRVEFVNGHMVGLTQDDKISKTVLSFMVQSVRGKYKDVVKLVPVEKLNVDILYENFKCVMTEVSRFFHIIGISEDNHAVIR